MSGYMNNIIAGEIFIPLVGMLSLAILIVIVIVIVTIIVVVLWKVRYHRLPAQFLKIIIFLCVVLLLVAVNDFRSTKNREDFYRCQAYKEGC